MAYADPIRSLTVSVNDIADLIDGVYAGSYFRPELYGAIGNGIADDSAAVQDAIDAAVATGGTVLLAGGSSYKIGTQLTIPITADHVSIRGYGSKLIGACNSTILKISDTSTTNDHATDIALMGFTIEGSGDTDTVLANQCGIEIGAIISCYLKDISIWEIPKTGIIGTKSAASGSTYWNKVNFDNVSVRFCGAQTIKIGTGDAVDDFCFVNCLFNHGGSQITTNSANGSAYINAISLYGAGTEVSGNYSATTAGAGYRWGMQIVTAGGALMGMHWELNGNDQAGSADLLLDTSADGLQVIGSNHYGSDVTGAKRCIETTCDGNFITGVVYAGSMTHKYDYVVNGSGATKLSVGSIVDIGGVGVNTAVVNFGTNAVVFDAHDTNCACGNGIIATNATDGFLYIPSCAGTPTGVPTTKYGYVPIIVNSTNNKLYFYSGGAWRDAGP